MADKIDWDRIWTAEDITQFLRIKIRTYRKWLKTKNLRKIAHKKGGKLLFDREEVKEWFKKTFPKY